MPHSDKREAFKKVLLDNRWEKKSELEYSLGEFQIALSSDSWRMVRGEEVIAEGSFAEKAYAVVESALDKLGLID